MLRGPYLYPTTTERFFEENKASIRSQATVLDWTCTFRQLQASYPACRVEQFDREMLKSYLTQGVCSDGSPWSGGTIAKKRTAIRSLFSWATEVGLMGKYKADPSSYLHKSVRVSTQAVKQHLWLDEDQLQSLLDGLPETLVGQRDRVAIGLGCYAGLRVSEIAALRWSEVKSDHLVVVDGKGGKTAEAPLGRRLGELLAGWKRTYAIGLGAVPLVHPVVIRFRGVGDCHFGENHTVPCWGQSLGRKGVYSLVSRAGGTAHHPGLAPHDLRRSFAGCLQDKGVPVEKISQALRHDNVSTTSGYLSRNPRRVRDALRAVDFG